MFKTSLRALLPVLLMCVTVEVAAGPLDKAFKALEDHDYFKARSLFNKQIRKHPVAAWYGLSVITGRANNPFFSIDSAYTHIQRADAAFTMAKDKERAFIGRFGVDHAALEAQKNHVFELAWQVAKGQHTVVAYDRFIERFIGAPQIGDATLVRDHLAFEQARQANTAIAYQQFLDRYPMAREVYEARTRLQGSIFREATSGGGLDAHIAFIHAHPESPYVRQAEDEVYRLSTPGRTVQEYRKFIADHPRNRNVSDAWRNIYEAYTRDLSVGAITRFLQEFPDYPFVEELVDDYRMASLYLLLFCRGDVWGFMDDQGVERIKAAYDWVEPF